MIRALIPCCLLFAAPAAAQVLLGNAVAVDGDTLDMTGTRIRLFGIDAIESEQTCTRGGAEWACGAEARRVLAALVRGRDVTCQQRDIDVYGRIVAVCRAGGLDLSEALGVFMRDFGGFGGGLDEMFGGARRGGSVRTGADVKVTVQLSLGEVATGVERTLLLKLLEGCDRCEGSGAEPGTQLVGRDQRSVAHDTHPAPLAAARL